MYYPTGKSTGGRCLVCMDDEAKEIEEALCRCHASKMVEGLKNWLDEKGYCVECWQMKENLTKRGAPADKLDEDMAAPAGGAGGSFATLGNTPGMGIAAPPTNSGTNASFYDATKSGSGDKFPSLTTGTPAAKKKKKGSSIVSYLDYIKGASRNKQ